MTVKTTPILYFGRDVTALCDAKCNKAWGINNRPKEQLDSYNEDDYEFLADSELGKAPEDPGTSEGWHRKPVEDHTDMPHNKWCVRECERSTVARPGQVVELPSFVERRKNLPG